MDRLVTFESAAEQVWRVHLAVRMLRLQMKLFLAVGMEASLYWGEDGDLDARAAAINRLTGLGPAALAFTNVTPPEQTVVRS